MAKRDPIHDQITRGRVVTLFDDLFPDAAPFCEPSPLLFKSLVQGRCWHCRHLTWWIFYGFNPHRGAMVCGLDCIDELDALKHYRG